MKRVGWLLLLMPLMAIGQFRTGDKITINDPQDDDIYLAGEYLSVDAAVDGDVVAAGNYVYIRDSVAQDLVVVASEIQLHGNVNDDVRIAAGEINIDSEIGDDLILFGGQVRITKDALIKGNLTVFAGKVNVEGEILGDARISGGTVRMNGIIGGDARFKTSDLWIGGTIDGKSSIRADSFQLMDGARFYGDVVYWTDEGEIDFGNSLVNVSARYEEDMSEEIRGFPFGLFGAATLGFWLFYIASAFLIIVLLNLVFKKYLVKAADQLNTNLLRSIGYGFIYIIGLPVVIAVSFAIIIGIPLGLFLLFAYMFSLIFGHFVTAMIITYFLNNRNEKPWNFWTICILALAIAIILRLITLLPILGFLISVSIVAMAYGSIYLSLAGLKKRIEPSP